MEPASRAISYDAADRLTGAVLPSGTHISYGYDPDGRRVQQTIGSTATNYLWDVASTFGDVVLETADSGTIQASYLLGGTELLSQNRGGTVNYYLHDGQGSVRALADASGNVTDQYAYDAFGSVQNRQGTTVNPYQYTGQQFDALTGLYSLRARYYQPTLGRFLSRDTIEINPIHPNDLNRYGYTANNPINAFDPSGHSDLIETGSLYQKDAEEIEPVAEVGATTEDLLAADDAVLERESANALFRDARFFTKNGPLNVTVGEGQYVVDGEAHLLAGTNETNSSYFLSRIEESLRPLLPEDTTWLGGTEGTQHFEQLVVDFARGLPDNSRVIVGVANRICGEVCVPMIQELGGEQVSGGVWRIILENGTKIFLWAAEPRDKSCSSKRAPDEITRRLPLWELSIRRL